MKKILVLTLLISTFVQSQIMIDESTNIKYYQNVFEIENKKEIIKENANSWIVKNYRNTNEGIKMNSTDNLIAKGIFRGLYRDGLGSKSDCDVHYTLEISFKENKYRLTINDIYLEPDNEVHYYLANYGLIVPIDDDEKFRQVHAAFAENYAVIGKKMTVNLFNNPKKTKKNKERHLKYHEVIMPIVEKKFFEIADDLKKYMESSKDDDW